MPKPSVGRIVQVTVDPKINNGSDVAPAVITRVWSDTCVNLRVLHDNDPGNLPPGAEWLTSWPVHESREALEEHRAARQAELPEGQTVALHGAFWPPHV